MSPSAVVALGAVLLSFDVEASAHPPSPSPRTCDSVPRASPPPATPPGSRRMAGDGFGPHAVAAACADVVERLSVPRSQVKVLSAGPVTWTDGSLGCPQPDMMSTQALVPGFQVRLEARRKTYSYHGSASRPAFYCANPRVPTSPPSHAVE